MFPVNLLRQAFKYSVPCVSECYHFPFVSRHTWKQYPKQDFINKMLFLSTQNLAILALGILLIAVPGRMDDAEINSLADRFTNSLQAAYQQLGIQGPSGVIPVGQAEEKIRRLYADLGETLNRARQKAIHMRSLLISSKVDIFRVL